MKIASKYLIRMDTFCINFGMTGSGDGEFNQPCFLSVNKAGHLIVCDFGNRRVQVFELSGKVCDEVWNKRQRERRV